MDEQTIQHMEKSRENLETNYLTNVPEIMNKLFFHAMQTI
jgi:hypothetical protein